MRRLRYLNSVLTVIAVLLSINLYTMWTVSPGTSAFAPSQAGAAEGVVDARVQRKDMIDQLKLINSELKTLQSTLTSGKLHVTVDNPPSD